MYTISEIGKICGLSRTSLIYYDSINLLTPARTDKGYRIYTQKDLEKLKLICIYRNTGLSLEEIKEIFNQEQSSTREILENRLDELNRTISDLRKQQQLIIDILGSDQLLARSKVLTKEQWIEILRRSGFDDNAMMNWHKQFEQCAPKAHQDFLESLGIQQDEIKSIRRKSL